MSYTSRYKYAFQISGFSSNKLHKWKFSSQITNLFLVYYYYCCVLCVGLAVPIHSKMDRVVLRWPTCGVLTQNTAPRLWFSLYNFNHTRFLHENIILSNRKKITEIQFNLLGSIVMDEIVFARETIYTFLYSSDITWPRNMDAAAAAVRVPDDYLWIAGVDYASEVTSKNDEEHDEWEENRTQRDSTVWSESWRCTACSSNCQIVARGLFVLQKCSAESVKSRSWWFFWSVNVNSQVARTLLV